MPGSPGAERVHGARALPQLRGHVRSAVTGKSIGHAIVGLGGTRIEITVDADGAFALPLPAPGHYVVRTRALGYRPMEDTVTVGPREDVHLKIQLGDPPYVRCGF